MILKQRSPDEPVFSDPELDMNELPPGVDRRAFMMRSAVVGAAAVIAGCAPATASAASSRPARRRLRPQPSHPDLDVVKKAKGPVMTTIDEFYKVGPGPSSSHTIGPMRITYDFYQRCTKLPADQLAKATALKVQPVRQPQRHRQGPRHRARRARRHHRQGAGDGRPGVPRQPARQARSGLPGEARRQDVQRHRSRTSSTTRRRATSRTRTR